MSDSKARIRTLAFQVRRLDNPPAPVWSASPPPVRVSPPMSRAERTDIVVDRPRILTTHNLLNELREARRGR